MDTTWVYVVTRFGGGHFFQFIYENEEDATKCANRLKEIYPNEGILCEKNIVRKDYK